MGHRQGRHSLRLHYAHARFARRYYQEAGRAGREATPARCILLFNIQDRRTHKYFIGGRLRGARTRLKKKGLSEAAIAEEMKRLEEKRDNDEANLERMIAYGQTALCRWRALLDYFKAEGVAAEFRCGRWRQLSQTHRLPIAI